MALIVECHRASPGLTRVRRLRYLVFVKQDHYIEDRKELLVDDVDTSDSALHVVAICDGIAAGAVRFTLDASCSSVADRDFDFGPYLARGATSATGGKLCVSRDFRHREQIFTRMMACGYAWLHALGVTHVKGVVNPRIVSILLQRGYKVLSETFVGRHSKLPSIAVLLDLHAAPEATRSFIRRHHLGMDAETHRRAFMTRGESIRTTKSHDFRAASIVSGRASVGPAYGCRSESTRNVGPKDGWERIEEVHALSDLELILRNGEALA
jgi:N-acyl-L-homoserine lactone synthetase